MKRLRKHPLYRRRDMIVHRGEPPATYVIPLPEVLRDFAGDLGQFDLFIIEDESKKETKLMVAQGRLTDSEAKKMHEEIEEHGAVVDGGELQYEFLDFPGRDIGEVCTEAFEYMKGVVEKAERDFWASL